jgi:hypothetical protein
MPKKPFYEMNDFLIAPTGRRFQQAAHATPTRLSTTY